MQDMRKPLKSLHSNYLQMQGPTKYTYVEFYQSEVIVT